MSQNDFTIANQGFPAFRADLNSALQALASNSSGATAPSTTFANMWWYDSSNNIMYIRNEDNDAWIKFAELDQTNDKFVLSGTLQLDDGTVSAPALTFNSDTNMGIYRGGTDILKFVTAGTDAITINASQDVTLAGSLNFADNEKAIFGAGSDLQIYHDGSNSYISDEGTGHLYLRGTNLRLANTSGSENYLVATDGGSVTINHAGNVKLTTTSTGIDVTSTANSTLNITAGSTSDDSIINFVHGSTTDGGITYDHNGSYASEKMAFRAGNNGTHMYLTGDGNLLVGTTSINPADNNDASGSQLSSAGSIQTSVSNATPAIFNRGNDGGIIALLKSGVSVGSIGTSNGDLYIGTGDTGLRFHDGNNSIYSVNATTGAKINGAIDLGESAGRFKDLFLSGTIEIEQGSGNVAVGKDALSVNTGSQNTAVGHNSGTTLTTGTHNTLIGKDAGQLTETGGYNTFVGNDSGATVSTGAKNTIIGRFNGNQSGLDIRTLSNNIVLSDGDGNVRYFFNNNNVRHTFYSDVSTNWAMVVNNQGATNPYGLYVSFNGSSPDNNTALFFLGGDTTTTRVAIYGDGDIVNHDNSYGSLSDIKLKEQITNASSQWNDIKALTVRKYKMKSDVATGDSDAHWRLGLIAQEVETAGMNGLIKDNPDMIENEDGEIVNSGTTTKSVKYSILYMKAVKALQEAMERIETLEAKVATLEGE